MSSAMTYRVRAIRAYPSGKELRPHEKLILLLIATYFNEDEKHAYPSVESLALASGLGIRRTRDIIKKLEDDKCIWVSRDRRRADGTQQVSSYGFEAAFLDMAELVPNRSGDGETWRGKEPTETAPKPRGNPNPTRRQRKAASPGEAFESPSDSSSNLPASGVKPVSKPGEAGFNDGVKQASKPGEAAFENSEAGFTQMERSEASLIAAAKRTTEVHEAATLFSSASRQRKEPSDEMYAGYCRRALGRDLSAEELQLVRQIVPINPNALAAVLYLAMKAPAEEQKNVLLAFVEDPATGLGIFHEALAADEAKAANQ